MLDHVSITVSDMAAARRFYDAAFGALGVPCMGVEADWIGYGERCDTDHPGRSYLSIRIGPRPRETYGRHWCFKAPSRAAVDRFWRDGIEAGGIDDGPPGLRPDDHPSYYAAFLSDPDGNRVEAVCHRLDAGPGVDGSG